MNGTTYYYVVSAVGEGGEGQSSAQTSATPAAPTPPPSTNAISICWPTDQAVVSGTQPFKALLNGYSVSSYRMYWKVDGGQENLMANSNVDAPHKEAIVNVSGWNWRGRGPYVVTFVARDSTRNIIAQRSVSIFVAR